MRQNSLAQRIPDRVKIARRIVDNVARTNQYSDSQLIVYNLRSAKGSCDPDGKFRRKAKHVNSRINAVGVPFELCLPIEYFLGHGFIPFPLSSLILKYESRTLTEEEYTDFIESGVDELMHRWYPSYMQNALP